MSLWIPHRAETVGVYRDERAMRQGLGEAQRKFGSTTSDFLKVADYPEDSEDDSEDTDDQQTLNFVTRSNREFGLFGDDIPRARTCQAGLDQGLLLCHWAQAAHVAIGYADQPKGEFIHVAMKDVTVEPHSFHFVIANDEIGGKWFRCASMDEAFTITETAEFLFVLPTVSQNMTELIGLEKELGYLVESMMVIPFFRDLPDGELLRHIHELAGVSEDCPMKGKSLRDALVRRFRDPSGGGLDTLRIRNKIGERVRDRV